MAPARFCFGLVVALLALLLAGCSPLVDRTMAEQCRIAAAGLVTPVRLRVIDQSVLAPSGDLPGGIRLLVRPEDPDRRLSRVECRFAGFDLVALTTDAGRVDDTHLFFLKRFWLEAEDAPEQDPGVAVRTSAPHLSRRTAFLAQIGLDALPNAAVYGLMAAAFALVYGLHGRINLAFGEIAAIGGLAAVATDIAFAREPPALLLAGVAFAASWAAALHGRVAERLVFWPLRAASHQHFLVGTVGVALFLDEYLRLVSGSRPQWVAPILAEPLRLAEAGDFIVTATPIGLLLAVAALAAAAALLATFRYTRFGHAWRATADDALVAALFGVDPRRLSALTYLIATALVGLAGAGLTLAHGGTDVTYSSALGLRALIAAVIGGIGSVPGAFLGGVAVALVETLWSAYAPIASRDLVVDALLVAFLIFRPGGLFGYGALLPRRV